MFTNLALSLLIVTSLLGLAGCGATDSGHADNQSAQSSSINPGNGSGSSTTVPPVIIEQPVSRSVYEDENVQVSVEASGDDIAYQWQKAIDNSWIDLRGEDAASLNFSFITNVDTGLYRVEVSNAAGTVVSDTIELIVKERLSIVTGPVGGNRNEGSSIDFTVDVAGEPSYQYQWYRNSSALAENAKYVGTQTDHLVVNVLTVSDAGAYSVVVTNTDGQTVESNAAVLTVNGPAQITSNPVDVSIQEGRSRHLSVSAGGTGPIGYQWQKRTSSGWENIDGAVFNTLWISNASPADAGEYRCYVNNVVGVADFSASATVSVLSPVVITSQPSSSHGSSHRVAIGESVSYSVAATGTDVYYEWYRGGSRIHVGSTLNLGSVSASDSATYTCRARNSVNVVNCNDVTLTVLSPVSLSGQPQSQTFVEGGSGSLSVSATGTAPFSYQWQKSSGAGWVNVSGATSSTLSFGSVDSGDAGTYRVIVNNEVGRSATSSAANVDVIQRVAITQQPVSEYGSEYRGVVGESLTMTVAATGTDVEYAWYKNDVFVRAGATLSLSSVTASDAGVYHCRVSNSVGAENCASVELVILTPPSIVSQSSGVSVYEGADVQFELQVTGSPLPSIQWYKDGEPLVGRTSASLNLGTADLEEEGLYTCQVSNEAGTATCEAISLEVSEIVRISSSPSNQVLSSGSSTTLSVAATGEAPLTYTWYKDGDVLQSGVNLTSINLSNVGVSDGGAYHVAVSNQGSGATSNHANITVLAPVLGTARISWAAPQERSDGDDLEGYEIQGYKIYKRLDDGSFTEVASATSDQNSVQIEDLELGVHYFTLTTVDTNDMESGMSAIVAVTISN